MFKIGIEKEKKRMKNVGGWVNALTTTNTGKESSNLYQRAVCELIAARKKHQTALETFCRRLLREIPDLVIIEAKKGYDSVFIDMLSTEAYRQTHSSGHFIECRVSVGGRPFSIEDCEYMVQQVDTFLATQGSLNWKWHSALQLRITWPIPKAE